MLFYKGLEREIFNKHEFLDSDELVVLSGYLGPNPVSMLNNLPLKSTVIYGMFVESGIADKLHEKLVNIDKASSKVDILYSGIPIHSKCYLWKRNNQVIHALVGSANFSASGLKTPYREILAETTRETFNPLNDYVLRILSESMRCTEYTGELLEEVAEEKSSYEVTPPLYSLSLTYKNGKVPDKSGINWGHSDGNVTVGDAYLGISSELIRESGLFPPKKDRPELSSTGGWKQRQNDPIEIIWDDGTTMEGLLEGSKPVDGIKYPKQISSIPNKNILGSYLRKRMKLSPEEFVTSKHLQTYGRSNISISYLNEGIYYCDFSV